MTDPETSEHQQSQRHESGQHRDRTPFDTSDLNQIPGPTDEDPPYRDWWVVLDTKSR